MLQTGKIIAFVGSADLDQARVFYERTLGLRMIERNDSPSMFNNFTDVVYPGQLNRCDACHVGTSYYPVADSAVQATTFFTGLSTQSPNPTTVGNPIATSANMSVCSACHVDTVTQAHMQQNGGSATVTKDAEGRTILSTNPANVETCAVCHGAGGVADVRVVHNIPATAD